MGQKFPKQDESLIGLQVIVTIDCDVTNLLYGSIVRADAEPPFIKIFELENGRYVLASECQHNVSQFQDDERPRFKSFGDAILDLQKRLAEIERTMDYNAEVERNRQEM